MKWVLSSLCVAALLLGLFSLSLAHEGHDHEKAAPSETDKLLVRAQQICPVSGIKLGGHGSPIKTKSGEQTIFVCCQGCVGKKLDAKYEKTVTSNLAAAQGLCPVMNKPLPEKPTSMVVTGRRVFVCCPPCTKKIKADPEKYLKIVDAQLAKNLGEGKDAR